MRRWILFWIVFATISGTKAQKSDRKRIKELPPVHGINFKFSSKTLKFSEPLNKAAYEFPELSGLSIEVRRRHIGTMMAARPKPGFIFRKKQNRKYVIYITDKPEMNADTLYSKMSYNAQLGVFGHELSHILDYNSKNNWQMLGFGIKYVFNKKSIEAITDQEAIKRGFGEELIEYTRYIHKSPHVNKKYLLKKKKFYLSTTELEENFFDNAIKL